MNAGPREARELTALEMARNAARAVLRYADHQDRDPLGSYIARGGQQGHQAAQLAGQMALVSIAESLAKIADDIAYLVDDGGTPYRPMEDVPLPDDGEPP